MSMDVSGLARVQSRIAEIESRIAAFEGPKIPTYPVAAPGSPTFPQALATAMGPAPTGTGAAPGGMPAPPNFVGPMPVRPSAGGASGVSQWQPIIDKYASEYGVSTDLIRAVMQQESGGNPRAVSRAGAMGLMQLMPDTARGLGVADPFDPEQNVRGGVALLKENLDRYNGDVSLALAAYNAGPGNVAKYKGVPPFRETQDYIRRITSRLNGG